MDDDDDDDDIGPEMGTPPLDHQVPREQSLPPHLQNQANYSHMRHAPSASPPMTNGVPFHQRQHTPQPGQMGSRPDSRNNMRRSSSSLVPAIYQQTTHAPQAPNGHAYANMYQHQPNHSMPMPPNNAQQNVHQMQQFAQQQQQQAPQHPQAHQAYLQDQRRQSMPPAFPQQERPQPPQHPAPSPPQNQAERQPQEDNSRLSKPAPSKSRSIYTPIDDSRSMLAQHWGIGKGSNDQVREIRTEKDRSQSIDMGNVQRNKTTDQISAPVKSQTETALGQKRQQEPAGEIQPPPRTGSAQTGGKRPRLKVQIPSEQSDEEGSATAQSSPRESGAPATGTPARASTDASHSSGTGVVLPPPSPSASAILSAGATGPPNPFARPHPPMTNNSNSQSYSSNNNIDTPMSALPSRFVDNGLLPSPSSFYPEWGFGRAGGDSNTMPSPLNFNQTPVMGGSHPSLARDEDSDRKRKSPDGDGQEGANIKRVKT